MFLTYITSNNGNKCYDICGKLLPPIGIQISLSAVRVSLLCCEREKDGECIQQINITIIIQMSLTADYCVVRIRCCVFVVVCSAVASTCIDTPNDLTRVHAICHRQAVKNEKNEWRTCK